MTYSTFETVRSPSSLTQPKIAIIGNHWFPTHPGGLDRYVYELAHHLVEAHHRVQLLGIGLPSQSAQPSLQLTNLAEPTEPLWRRLRSSYQAMAQLRNATAINIHFALYGLTALPHLPNDVPVTCTFHGPWAIESQQEGSRKLSVWLKQQMEQLVYRRCDRFIVLSKAFGTILHREYQIPWEKIHIIPGGVDTQQFQITQSREAARQQLGWPTDRFILFTPRRLVHRMGIDQLLTAIAQLKPQHPDLWLAIAGKGALRAALEQQVADLNLTDQVKFLGFLPDEQLPIAYQAADLTVMPSQSLEGFGLVLLESLACGTPALCTPVGGMPEVVSPLSPELITADKEADAIAHTLCEVVTGAVALPSRDRCRHYAATQFGWPTIAHQVQQVVL